MFVCCAEVRRVGCCFANCMCCVCVSCALLCFCLCVRVVCHRARLLARARTRLFAFGWCVEWRRRRAGPPVHPFGVGTRATHKIRRSTRGKLGRVRKAFSTCKRVTAAAVAKKNIIEEHGQRRAILEICVLCVCVVGKACFTYDADAAAAAAHQATTNTKQS